MAHITIHGNGNTIYPGGRGPSGFKLAGFVIAVLTLVATIAGVVAAMR